LFFHDLLVVLVGTHLAVIDEDLIHGDACFYL
jgi:hypothetical protein